MQDRILKTRSLASLGSDKNRRSHRANPVLHLANKLKQGSHCARDCFRTLTPRPENCESTCGMTSVHIRAHQTSATHRGSGLDVPCEKWVWMTASASEPSKTTIITAIDLGTMITSDDDNGDDGGGGGQRAWHRWHPFGRTSSDWNIATPIHGSRAVSKICNND